MTDPEILEKAVQKAIDGGWNSRVPLDDTAIITSIANNCISLKYISEGGAMSYSTTFSLFDKDFAKALWGKQRNTSKCHDSTMHRKTLINGKPLTKPYRSYLNENGTALRKGFTDTQFHYCDICKEPCGFNTYLGWKYYLQQMVIADDPIKYLGEHLDN